MPSADDIWEWIRAPLGDLKHDLSADPGKSWDTRRAEFLEQLGLSDPSQYPMIEHLFQHLDQMTDSDRADTIISNHIDTLVHELAQQYAESQEQADSADGPDYDEQDWHVYLAENGPYWDGTDESWDQFSQWFLYHAGERGLNEPATALIDHLTAQPAADRITTLVQYGVTISPAAAASQEPATSPAEQPAEQVAEQPDTSADSGEDPDRAMGEILAEHPDLADIPEERRREILAEVLAESPS